MFAVATARRGGFRVRVRLGLGLGLLLPGGEDSTMIPLIHHPPGRECSGKLDPAGIASRVRMNCGSSSNVIWVGTETRDSWSKIGGWCTGKTSSFLFSGTALKSTVCRVDKM